MRIAFGLASRREQADFSDDYAAALERARARCMTQKGFEYEEAPVRALSLPPSNLSASTLDYAKAFGFGLFDVGDQQSAPNPNDALRQRMSDEELDSYDAAFDQCSAVAQSDNPVTAEVSRTIELIGEIEARVDSNPNVLAARSAWRECLEGKGFSSPGADPDEFRERYVDRYRDVVEDGSEVASFDREQIAAAVASIECASDLEAAVLAARKSELERLDPARFDAVFNS